MLLLTKPDTLPSASSFTFVKKDNWLSILEQCVGVLFLMQSVRYQPDTLPPIYIIYKFIDQDKIDK